MSHSDQVAKKIAQQAYDQSLLQGYERLRKDTIYNEEVAHFQEQARYLQDYQEMLSQTCPENT